MTVAAIVVVGLTVLVVGGLGYVCSMWWLRRTGRVGPPSTYITGTGLIVLGAILTVILLGLAVSVVAPESWFGAWLRNRNFVVFLVIVGGVGVVAEVVLTKKGRPVIKRNGGAV